MQQTVHRLINGDARDLSFLPDKSVHLVVTSPPYWNLKRYAENPDQLGHIKDYETFLAELAKVWTHVLRVLVPGAGLSVSSATCVWPVGILAVIWYFRSTPTSAFSADGSASIT